MFVGLRGWGMLRPRKATLGLHIHHLFWGFQLFHLHPIPPYLFLVVAFLFLYLHLRSRSFRPMEKEKGRAGRGGKEVKKGYTPTDAVEG